VTATEENTGEEGSQGLLLEVGASARLEMPAEPQDLRVHLRQRALESDDESRANFEGCIAVWVWERWRASLEPEGFARESFIDVVAGYRRELWLWILGDRTWAEVMSSLAGRIARRLRSGAAHG
jgi:hypothetical protein